ncbi:MAG: hypothetical protein WCG06_06775, partial [Candidatus Omnitrophota bacterium]
MTKTKSNRTPSKRTPLLTVCLVKMGSLPAAIALISALGCILILSTLLESRMGTAFAQRFFYQAGWFDTLLALLGLNILCATLLRLPFQRRHIAFVTTHTGILILLAGSLVTRLQSVEGQMTLYENESSGQVRLDQYQLTVHSKDDNLCPAGLSLSPGKIPRDTAIGSNLRLSVLEMLENASQETDVTEGPPASPSNPAIRLTLVSVHQNVEETFWLIRKNPLNPASDSASLGPLSVELKNSRPKELLKNPMLE